MLSRKKFIKESTVVFINVLLHLSSSYPLLAQIASDGTLPTQVIKSAEGFEIIGGEQVGRNLFHSFLEFSIPSGQEAFFNNASTVENIIGRITGNSASNIDGVIRANGQANLFLINPNGFFFGPQAGLMIGGSFLASTANKITFADGTEFKTTDSAATPPLLTMSAPIGLGLESNSGSIRIQGRGHNLTVENPDQVSSQLKRQPSSTELRVKPGNTIALIGGDINLTGATLIAEGGQIILGSVDQGFVSFNHTVTGWQFDYEEVQGFGEIELSSRSLIDASGNSSGSIYIQGHNITLADESVLLIRNLGKQAGGNIILNASDSIIVSGTSVDRQIRSGLYNENVDQGQGGDIAISSQELLVEEGGLIVTQGFSSPAKSGDITISSSESVKIIGFSTIRPNIFSLITSTTFGSGKSGNVSVNTSTLTILEGGSIAAGTGGSGAGGDVIVKATEAIHLQGVNPVTFFPSSLSAATTNSGNAGNLLITTSKLIVQDGARVDSSTLASGSAGSVTINASEFIRITGKFSGVINPSQVISSANRVDESLQRLLSVPPIPSGDSGNVRINTPYVYVSDGAQITVTNDGTGDAGNLQIMADSIFLNQQGAITASTVSGEGGNISLNVGNILRLSNNSSVSATAGASGNGGNIDINARYIFATPNQNSDITANAFGGRGGNINITTEGLFGIIPRDRSTSLSDISASSELGISGVIQVNRPDYEPQDQLSQNPNQPNAPQLTQGCQGGTAQTASRFVIIGRGGISSNPTEPLSNNNIWEDLQPPQSSNETQSTTSAQIIEAQGWIIDSQGKVILVSQDPKIITKLKCETQDLY